MQKKSTIKKLILGLIILALGSMQQVAEADNNSTKISQQKTHNCQINQQQPNFLVFGGGGTPARNEIAIEKNVLYFQRTLEKMGYNPLTATKFFANGNDGQATVRYIDELGKQRFKVP